MSMEYSDRDYLCARRICEAMETWKIKPTKMAKDLGLTRAHVSLIRARGCKSINMLIRIADYLNVSLDWLVGRDGK